MLFDTEPYSNLLPFQAELAQKYGYRKLSEKLSIHVRSMYYDNIPPQLKLAGDKGFLIHSLNGSLIAKGYERIVVGDYGAFIEISPEQIILSNLKVKEGEEYRINDPKYRDRVKYQWFTAKDNSDIKVYFQQRTVTYADYKPQMYYVSPYEILLK